MRITTRCVSWTKPSLLPWNSRTDTSRNVFSQTRLSTLWTRLLPNCAWSETPYQRNSTTSVASSSSWKSSVKPLSVTWNLRSFPISRRILVRQSCQRLKRKSLICAKKKLITRQNGRLNVVSSTKSSKTSNRLNSSSLRLKGLNVKATTDVWQKYAMAGFRLLRLKSSPSKRNWQRRKQAMP